MLVTGQKPFYRTSKELQHHLLIIEQTQTVIELESPIFGFESIDIEHET